MVLTPLPTIFQLYRGGSILLVEKTTDMLQVTDKLYQIMFFARAVFEITTLVVIDTDCIGSYISNYNTISTTKNLICEGTLYCLAKK